MHPPQNDIIFTHHTPEWHYLYTPIPQWHYMYLYAPHPTMTLSLRTHSTMTLSLRTHPTMTLQKNVPLCTPPHNDIMFTHPSQSVISFTYPPHNDITFDFFIPTASSSTDMDSISSDMWLKHAHTRNTIQMLAFCVVSWHQYTHPMSGNNQSVESSVPVVSRWCWPGNRALLQVASMDSYLVDSGFLHNKPWYYCALAWDESDPIS